MGIVALTFDLTVSLGNILTIAATVVSILVAYARIRERLVRIETQLGPLWSEFERRRRAR